MSNPTRNSTIILFLSDYNGKKVAEEEYTDPSGKKFKGTQTNDAPTKHLLKTAADKRQPVSKILCITSEKVFNKNAENRNKPAFVLYKEMVENYCDSVKYPKPEIVPIYYDFKVSTLEGSETVTPISKAADRPMYIYRQIAEELNKSENTHIYVDYTGGVRDTSFLMTVIIRYLEFETIQCEEIVYSNYSDLTIYNITYIYDMFQMINGASEFVETGNAKQLKKISTETLNDDARNLVDSIVIFSNTISLCDIGNIDAAINGIAKNLKSIENKEESKTASDDIFMEMLRSLVPIIKEKMYIEGADTGTITYPKLVRWCAENGLIQQAVTLYIEKMPIFYYENGVIPDDIKQECDAVDFAVPRGATKETTAFYEKLFKKYSTKTIMAKFRENLEKLMESIDVQSDEFDKQFEEFMSNDCAHIFPNESERENIIDMMKKIKNNFESGEGINIYDEPNNVPSSFESFFSALVNNDTKCLHYLLYDDKDSYALSEGSYAKKVAALNNMAKRKDFITNYDVIFPKMKYYLALKLVRNKMNHASEKEVSEDEKAAIDWLKKQGITINMDFDNIKGIILAGIES